MAKYSSIAQMYHFADPVMNEWTYVLFPLFGFMNKVDMNICVRLLVWTCRFWVVLDVHVLGSEIAGSRGNYLNFWDFLIILSGPLFLSSWRSLMFHKA